MLLPVRSGRSRVSHGTVAGIAVVAARKWEAAEDHFQIAVRHAESFPTAFDKAEVRHFYAITLV